jgi:hypothetical protein
MEHHWASAIALCGPLLYSIVEPDSSMVQHHLCMPGDLETVISLV